MNLPRQLLAYLGIGVLQWLLDSAVMVGLSHAGLAVASATVCGRISGAALGYGLNGRYTFGKTLDARSLRRFIGFWLLATLLSALLLGWIDHRFGLRSSWLCKPVVDGVFAGAGFIAARCWIYRRTAGPR